MMVIFVKMRILTAILICHCNAFVMVLGTENNLYPFLFLTPDGNLFIFANQDSILLDYRRNIVVRKYPRIADGPRNYPASGAAVLLPLTASDGYTKAEVLVCGGATVGAFQNVGRGLFDVALQSCGRMVVTAAAPKWTMVTNLSAFFFVAIDRQLAI